MSGQVDEISRILGELLQDKETGQRQRADMYQKIGELHTSVTQISEALKVIPDLKKAMEDYNKVKNRGAGILFAIGCLAGSAGAGVTYALKTLGIK